MSVVLPWTGEVATGQLAPVRQIAHTCSGSGEDIGEGMQRSRCYSASICQVVGHSDWRQVEC